MMAGDAPRRRALALVLLIAGAAPAVPASAQDGAERGGADETPPRAPARELPPAAGGAEEGDRQGPADAAGDDRAEPSGAPQRPFPRDPEPGAPAREVPPPPKDAAKQPPPRGDTDPTASSSGSSDAPQRRVIVIDAATYGIDAVVGRHATYRMRQTAKDTGYAVLGPDETVRAAQRLEMPYPPAPADLWRVTWVAEAHRGAFARVWAHDGRYVIEITVASLDGRGPFFARGTSGSGDLHQVVARLLREAMPPPDRWDVEAAKRLSRRRERAAGERPPSRGADEQAGDATGTSKPAPPPPEREAPEPAPQEPEGPMRHWDLAFQTEGAIGTSENIFYNHMAGARIGYRITRRILLGAYVGYANLRGENGRVHNMVMYAQLEHRVRISTANDLTIPLRFGAGYVPYNGPMLRLAAGLNIPIARRVELGFDLLSPTFWVLPSGTTVSLDVAAELVFRL